MIPNSFWIISVTPEGSRVGVSINLEDAFLDYQTGSQFTAVMNRLADTLVGTLGEREQFDLGFLDDYSAVKDMLTVEVVGKDQNAEMLQSVPHQEMEDLAAVYRIDLGETENGNATVLITNEMMRNYGLTPDQLHKDALDAAQHTMKYSIRSMDEVLMGMAQRLGIEEDQPVMFSSPLYVATTERDMFGAGVLAVPSFFEDAAEKLDGNFYVLPSSVHEILLLPDRFAPEPQLLKEMVQDVNANEVDPKDRLSDNVYHYDAKERIFELAVNWLRNMSAGWKKNQKIKNRRDILCYLNWGISRKSVPDLRRNRGVHRKRQKWKSEEGDMNGIRTIY